LKSAQNLLVDDESGPAAVEDAAGAGSAPSVACGAALAAQPTGDRFMSDDRDAPVSGEHVRLDGEDYYRIANAHRMPDFFMSLVGAGDHWMFISSSGALTAGRRNADRALFPYAADDQIVASRGGTGPATWLRTEIAGEGHVWEPFSAQVPGRFRIRRNLYKTPLSNKLVCEEINDSLALAFRYRWAFSERFGFVRSCRLENTGGERRSVDLLDGLRNLLPWGVGSDFQMRFSNLANAYKKSEWVAEGGLGLFYLSSIPTDRAEPSEGLRATVAWCAGLQPDAILLCADQIDGFLRGGSVQTETDVRGRPGALLAGQRLDLAPGEAIEWHVVADVALDHAAVVALADWRQRAVDPAGEIAADIARGEQEFRRILSSADGMQCTANRQRCSRHLSNSIFNVMRGGLPLEDYRISAADFRSYVSHFNRETFARHERLLGELPESLLLEALRARIAACGDPDLERLGNEYLPLAFSRRHGDPTRPWNHFSIELRTADGRVNLNYQGNWRDIFQNWEALLVSFPCFATAMICRFVNATTTDGYNPYRLTRNGFEWEEPSPDEPWANIGYWGDHQIIYLLRLLEWARRFDPTGLDGLLDRSVFAHAIVPYRIRGYEAMRADGRNTIDFDADLAADLRERVAAVGADGKLLREAGGAIHHVSLLEKILTLSLAKMANFVPDGGIWLNTQRPEWNDANNALVGNGVSMVTACYLHRWFAFLEDWIPAQATESFAVSQEVAACFREISAILGEHPAASGINAAAREELVAALARAGGAFRDGLYASGLSGATTDLPVADCGAFFAAARQHLAATIRGNRRPDGLYHSYNLLDWKTGGLGIEPLDEMLEGQVAALSAGLLPPGECVELLDALRTSALYRADQESYLLYPNRTLPRFLEKNRVDAATVAANPLLARLLDRGDGRILQRDVHGVLHFSGDFRNAADLREVLGELGAEYADDVAAHGAAAVRLFEETFGHRRFTGRSGTFFAYEGLGSIYWHMVSKLGLAVSENFFAALETGESPDVVDALAAHYRAIRRGIGAEKSPEQYGAFPSDPYSHSPENAGVKQPGMTGQVKEDLLSRFAELGVDIEAGCLGFRPALFDRSELLEEPSELRFFDLQGEERAVAIPANAYAFTLFQVPVLCQPGEEDRVEVVRAGGGSQVISGSRLDAETSRELFSRAGTVDRIVCRLRGLRG
jgi:hypothetical protein